MKKILRLKESNLIQIVRNIVNEGANPNPGFLRKFLPLTKGGYFGWEEIKDQIERELLRGGGFYNFSKKELTYKGDLLLNYKSDYAKLKELPEDLDIRGNLNIHNTNIERLPSSLKIKGNLILGNSPFGKKYKDTDIKRLLGSNLKGEIIR
jgi:hypothetical protein